MELTNRVYRNRLTEDLAADRASRVLEELAQKLTLRFDDKVSIQDIETRWGSCREPVFVVVQSRDLSDCYSNSNEVRLYGSTEEVQKFDELVRGRK